MGLSQNERLPRGSTTRYLYGASREIHHNTFRGVPLALPKSDHRVQMKYFHGVELLLVLLAGEEEPYCSLRHLEATLRQPDLVEFMNNLGLRFETITAKDTGILPDIINLRCGILEKEPVLIKWRAVECILKHIGLAFLAPPAVEVDSEVEKLGNNLTKTEEAPEIDSEVKAEDSDGKATTKAKPKRNSWKLAGCETGKRLFRY